MTCGDCWVLGPHIKVSPGKLPFLLLLVRLFALTLSLHSSLLFSLAQALQHVSTPAAQLETILSCYGGSADCSISRARSHSCFWLSQKRDTAQTPQLLKIDIIHHYYFSLTQENFYRYPCTKFAKIKKFIVCGLNFLDMNRFKAELEAIGALNTVLVLSPEASAVEYVCFTGFSQQWDVR